MLRTKSNMLWRCIRRVEGRVEYLHMVNNRPLWSADPKLARTWADYWKARRVADSEQADVEQARWL